MGTVVLTGPTDGIDSNWQAPTFESSPEDRLAWVEEQIQEGEGWLINQPAYKNLQKNIKIYEAIFSDNTKSMLKTNSLKYNVRKFVETLSEVREIALYGSDAKQYKPIAEIENKVAKCLYLESQFPRQLRKALQYAAVMGIGYLWPRCVAVDYGYGERIIEFRPLGPLDVVPTQVPTTNEVEDAYTVTIYEYMPVAEAHGRFPLFQDQLKPVSMGDVKSRLQARRLDFAERTAYDAQGRKWGDLYCEIRYTFIRDLRINRTGQTLPMGDPGTSWFYEVPSVGSQIFGGIQGGQPFYREATPEDCRVYPQLRLIITAKGVDIPMYDGPAYDWHGKMPPVQYTVDDVPWEPGGRSLVEDVGSIEQTKRKLERKMDQVISTTLNPPMAYDRTAIQGPKVENYDIFEENSRIGVDGQPAQVLQSALPPSVVVTGEHFNFLEYLGKSETDQLGITDLGNLANLKLNVNEEGMDKALESIGPIAKGIAASMEAANAKIGFRLKFMIPQWISTARVIQYIGPDNITQEVYDFDPASLVPSHMPEEFVVEMDPATGAILSINPPQSPSQYDKIQRAKRFAQNLRLVSIPSTLLKITQVQEQLKWLQLWRGGAPIAFCSVAKKLDIENYGDVPGVTEFERWQNEQIIMLKFKLATAMLAAQIGAPLAGGPGQGAPAAGAPSGTGPGSGAGPHEGGRPPSGKAPPKLVEKGKSNWQPRTTVSESG